MEYLVNLPVPNTVAITQNALGIIVLEARESEIFMGSEIRIF